MKLPEFTVKKCTSRFLEEIRDFLTNTASQSTVFSYLLARVQNWRLWYNKPCVHSCRRERRGGCVLRPRGLREIMGHLAPCSRWSRQFWNWILSCRDGNSLKRKALLNIRAALKPVPGRYWDFYTVGGKAVCAGLSQTGTKVVEKSR